MQTFDLDEDLDGARPEPRAAARLSRRSRCWLAAGILLVIVAGALGGLDQRDREREFAALLEQVTLGQAAIRYSDARIQAMVQYTSPQLLSARAPERVRSSLRGLVQEAAADRVAPLQARRDAVADLAVTRWHTDERRARDAYLQYLQVRVAHLQAVAVDLRTLYRPQPEHARRLAAAQEALISASPDEAAANQAKALLP